MAKKIESADVHGSEVVAILVAAGGSRNNN
jgi:hypothetical protein